MGRFLDVYKRQAQAHQSLKNVQGLLESQGLTFANVIKTTVFLDNMDDFVTVNDIYAQYFVEPFPARSAVEVAKLPKDVYKRQVFNIFVIY